MLSEHPQLFMAEGEPWYFSKAELPPAAGYVERFADAEPGTLLGEGSTSYSSVVSEERARLRILNLYPEIKLIFIARDPFDRIESSYREFHNSGHRLSTECPFDLDDALRDIPQLLEDTNYWARLQNYRPYVREDQVLVVFLEDLARQPSQVLARCFEFLGVDVDVHIPDTARRLNPGGAKLFDTPRMRRLRLEIGPGSPCSLLGLVPLDVEDRLLAALGLRKRFPRGRLDWTAAAHRRVIETVGDDVLRFLDSCGRSREVWPRFDAAMGGAPPDAPPELADGSPQARGHAELVLFLDEREGETSAELRCRLEELGAVVTLQDPETEVEPLNQICKVVGRSAVLLSRRASPAVDRSGITVPVVGLDELLGADVDPAASEEWDGAVLGRRLSELSSRRRR